MTPTRLILAALVTLGSITLASAQTEPAPAAPAPAQNTAEPAPAAAQAPAQAPAAAAEAPSPGPMPLQPGTATAPAPEVVPVAPAAPAVAQTPPAAAAEADPASAGDAGPTRRAVVARTPRSLVIGISDNAPPFSSLSRLGVRSGFDVDVAFAICLRIDADCRLLPLQSADMPAALKDKRVDFIAASSGGMDRFAEVATFTDPYVSLVARYVVPRETSKDLEGEEDAVFSAVVDTIYAQYLEEIHKRPGAVRLYDRATEMWIDLALGRIDAALATAVTARKEFLGTPMGEGFRLATLPVKDPSIGAREAGFAVRSADTELRSDLNTAIADYLASPDYKETLARHLGGGLADAPQPRKTATGG